MDYRKTLNLPQTDFAMKADLASKEPRLLEAWARDGLYGQIQKRWSASNKTFLLHDGPPYANGRIHIGHALNKILKDMIIKYKTMKGFNASYLPGWDCHGLPIEHQLLKELKKDKSQMEHVSFRRQAHDYAMKYVGIQREEFKRLGIFGEWDKPYLTLTHDYEYWILKSLQALIEKGYIYRGLKPVNWCFHCETALAEAEVEYEEHTSPAVYVKLKIDNPAFTGDLPKGRDVYLLIWTTTPWTLIANVAVAVHQKYQYALVEVADEVLVIESSLVQRVLSQKAIISAKVIKEINGAELKGIPYAHPLALRKNCPVIVVDYVTKEEGTGLVHTAPGHGQEDFQAGLANNLEVVMPVDHRGHFTDDAGEFAGMHVLKANELIIERLRHTGLLFHADKIQHTYPHCWRCKNPIICRATEQWFLNVDHQNLRDRLTDVIKNEVQWIPPSGQERILGMIAMRPDWCLSRQRFWGVPIPAVICHGCNNEHKLFAEVIEHFAEMVKRNGTDVWFQKPLKELIPAHFVCPTCHKSDFKKTQDILDVWFDSGVSHQAVLKGIMRHPRPADLYLEGSDQHRGWFQSSLIAAMAMEGRPPFKAVLTHGFVVDGQGRKMSKSLGNVIAPQEVIKNYGADILRLWVASSNYHEDVRLSQEIIERLTDAYRKIRNTIRFMLSNIYDFDPPRDEVEYQNLLEIDRWALCRLARMLDTVEVHCEHYDFDQATKTIYLFCNDDLSSIYLDILKDRLYILSAHSPERRSAQTVLYKILQVLARVIAPILSFTAQEIYQFLSKTPPGQETSLVHCLDWPRAANTWKASQIEEKFEILILLRPEILKALEEKRQKGDIGSSLDAKVIIETASDTCFDGLEQNLESLRYFFIVSQVEVKKVDHLGEGLSPDFPTTRIMIDKADGRKCVRCWNYSPHVGHDTLHPMLCERCVPIVKEMTHAPQQ